MGRSPVTYFEGRCVGGTTVINGGMCWRTPDEVLNHWTEDFGLPDLSVDALEPVFEHVEKTINARHQDPGSEGNCNQVFRRGAERLGWKLNPNKRNQVHCVGSNECVTGCPSGAKQSTLYSWLPRFFACGGRLYKMKVQRIITSDGRVQGVSGVVLDPFRHQVPKSRRDRCSGVWRSANASAYATQQTRAGMGRWVAISRFIQTLKWRPCS